MCCAADLRGHEALAREPCHRRAYVRRSRLADQVGAVLRDRGRERREVALGGLAREGNVLLGVLGLLARRPRGHRAVDQPLHCRRRAVGLQRARDVRCGGLARQGHLQLVNLRLRRVGAADRRQRRARLRRDGAVHLGCGAVGHQRGREGVRRRLPVHGRRERVEGALVRLLRKRGVHARAERAHRGLGCGAGTLCGGDVSLAAVPRELRHGGVGGEGGTVRLGAQRGRGAPLEAGDGGRVRGDARGVLRHIRFGLGQLRVRYVACQRAVQGGHGDEAVPVARVPRRRSAKHLVIPFSYREESLLSPARPRFPRESR